MDATTTRSVVVGAFGSYDRIEVKDHPLAPLDSDDVEVQVAYCGLNFADLYSRQGAGIARSFPFILGIECCGIVTAAGGNVKQLKIGQKVICYDHNGGLHRKRVRIFVGKCYPVPENVELKVAAAIFVNYLTAHFALFAVGNLRDGQSVFIPSCAGGVGWAATQLAKTVGGVKIYGSCGVNKVARVLANGVFRVLTVDDLKGDEYAKKFDLVVDNQSGDLFNVLENTVRGLGRIVMIGANHLIANDAQIPVKTLMESVCFDSASKTSLIMNNRSVCGLHLGVLAESEAALVVNCLNNIFDLLLAGKISPQIDGVWDFDDVVLATKRLAERLNVGKVLLHVVQ